MEWKSGKEGGSDMHALVVATSGGIIYHISEKLKKKFAYCNLNLCEKQR